MGSRFEWRHQYDDERDAFERELTDVDTGSESMVQQQFAEDADINVIVRRFGLSDTVPPQALDPRYFGDLGEIPDLGTALRLVKDAQDKFNALPVDLRNRFQNSPALLWNFVNDPRNAEESVRLGLLARRETPTPAVQPPSAVGTEAEAPVTSASRAP